MSRIVIGFVPMLTVLVLSACGDSSDSNGSAMSVGGASVGAGATGGTGAGTAGTGPLTTGGMFGGGVAGAGSSVTDAGGGECDAPQSAPAWAAWPMPNPSSAGLPNPASYTANGDGTVRDDVTGLVWQQQADANTYKRSDAEKYCADLALAGQCDWRLPSRIELVSLFDFTATRDATIDPTAFPDTPAEPFWSLPHWQVDFRNGWVDFRADSDAVRVRCVRLGTVAKSPPARYETKDGTVLDTDTGLTWQQVLDSGELIWSEATEYCDALSLAGDGWRVPSINELETIVDVEDRDVAMIYSAAFPNTPPGSQGGASSSFWSSSVDKGGSDVWTVHFGTGTVRDLQMSAPGPVRCVR